MEKRVEWLDLCKFVGIFFMVWGHSGVSIPVDNYLHSFHMPIFFFLSGYLFQVFKYTFLKLLTSRFKALIIPYLFFGFGLCLVWNLYYGWADPSRTVPWDKIVSSAFLYNADFSPFAAIQWFLTSLFFAELLFWILEKLCREKVIIITIVVFVLSIVSFGFPLWFHFRLILGIDTALCGTAFLGMGWLFRKAREIPAVCKVTTPNLILSMAFLLTGFFTSQANNYVNLRVMIYGDYFLFYGSALFTTIGYMMLCEFFCNAGFAQNAFCRLLLYIGRNTIIVLVLNQAIKTVLEMAFSLETIRLGMTETDILWFNGLLCAAILLLSVPTVWLINRYLPFSIGRKRVIKPQNN